MLSPTKETLHRNEDTTVLFIVDYTTPETILDILHRYDEDITQT